MACVKANQELLLGRASLKMGKDLNNLQQKLLAPGSMQSHGLAKSWVARQLTVTLSVLETMKSLINGLPTEPARQSHRTDSLEDLERPEVRMRVRSIFKCREFKTINVKASEMRSPASSHLEDGVHRGSMMNRSLGCGLAQEYWQARTRAKVVVLEQAWPQEPNSLSNILTQML